MTTGFERVPAVPANPYSREEAAVIAEELSGWIGHLLRMDAGGNIRTSALISDMRGRLEAMRRMERGESP